MPDQFESDTRKQLRKDYPGINWDEDEPATKPLVVAEPPKPGTLSRMAGSYGQMMRFMASPGTDEDFKAAFPGSPSDKVMDEVRKRNGYSQRLAGITGER